MEPNATMTVTLSIKHVPDDVAQRLRERAAANRRSLQQELLTIAEQAAASVHAVGIAEPAPAYVPARGRASAAKATKRGADQGRRLSLDELWRRARALGARGGGESSTAIVRRERDARNRR
jgi:plasmid stability protein